MSSLWPATISSLNDSVTTLHGTVGKLKAAKSVEVEEVIEQLKTAAECSRNLRALILSELPEASWENRQELDRVLEDVQKVLAAKSLEQQRARLLALAAELERGGIAHRRAARADQLNQLREQATNELRAQAGLEAPPALPGPERVEEWLEWACRLQEPEDAELLHTLRTGFAQLDDFVANLEFNMWTAKKESPV